MKKRSYYIACIILLLVVFALDSYGIVSGDKTYRYIFKPMITPLLLASYLVSAKRVNRIYVLALLIAFLGDIILLNSENIYFLLAVLSFFIIQLLYIIILTEDIKSYKRRDIYLAPLPFIIVLLSVIVLIYKNLGEFLVPILFYGIIISIFGTLSFYNYLRKRSLASLLLFLGAFFFIVSNAMSVIERFFLFNRDLAVIIMITYVGAQFLISRYMVIKSRTT